ncbi:MAG: hypothetical protein K0U93_16565 [Gammaproteobacteria bacterium]|nr:hypothetical protein [Gammaproteobacteria bacterium]
MPRHLVFVLSEPTAGNDDEFHEWYEHTHIDEVLDSANWHSGQRFELTYEAGPACPNPFLACYEVDAVDAATAVDQLNSSRDQREQSKSINKKTAAMWVFSPTGDKHERA